VTSGVLSPHQAMVYLETVFEQKQNISVVGIAGPGDPFANPDETLDTLRRVRATYPEMLICVATNGLHLGPYLDELVDLKLSHVTVTVNALDPEIGAQIYSWVRYGKRVLKAPKGAEILLQNQLAAIQGLKARGITVKINTIIIPGINDDHIETVAQEMAKLRVDILNCVPYYPSKGSAFENLAEPSDELVTAIRNKAGRYVKQMRHCTRCRADAVGLLGEAPDAALMNRLKACEQLVEGATAKTDDERPYVAVASMEGVLVNQHLGEASQLLIYGRNQGMISLKEARRTPAEGLGDLRWQQLAERIGDCGTLLVNGIGEKPKKALTAVGIQIFEIEGLIEDAVEAVFKGQTLNHLIKRRPAACGAACMGSGAGCG
jgi:nitrogen fixation protein NifB